jgi:hypothetical protein
MLSLWNYLFCRLSLLFPLKGLFIVNVIIVLMLPNLSSGQNLLNRPESVVFDSLHSRYLVSNWADGSIVQIDNTGNQTYFTTGHVSINGIWISGNAVFAGCSTKVKGFDLATGSSVMDLTIPGALNLNDVTADDVGHLYVTDFDKKEIIKINILSQAYSRYVTGLALNPNGILYDDSNNRLIVCSFGYNIPIISINLIDSSTSVVASTSLAQCDGFAKDDFGNYYISSWETKSIYRFDSDFNNPPYIFYTNTEAPVDISYNSNDGVLAVPIMWLNEIVLLPVAPSNTHNENLFPLEFKLCQNYPNPFNPETQIQFYLSTPSDVRLTVYDIQGNEVRTLLNEYKESGNYSVGWNGQNGVGGRVSSGVYIYILKLKDIISTKKMVLIK